jgi:hypothetical protein
MTDDSFAELKIGDLVRNNACVCRVTARHYDPDYGVSYTIRQLNKRGEIHGNACGTIIFSEAYKHSLLEVIDTCRHEDLYGSGYEGYEQ